MSFYKAGDGFATASKIPVKNQSFCYSGVQNILGLKNI